MLVEDIAIDVDTAPHTLNDYAIGDHKIGYDAGLNAGFDFGARSCRSGSRLQARFA
jgi:hypothetical protein